MIYHKFSGSLSRASFFRYEYCKHATLDPVHSANQPVTRVCCRRPRALVRSTTRNHHTTCHRSSLPSGPSVRASVPSFQCIFHTDTPPPRSVSAPLPFHLNLMSVLQHDTAMGGMAAVSGAAFRHQVGGGQARGKHS